MVKTKDKDEKKKKKKGKPVADEKQYCVKCKKPTGTRDTEIQQAKNGRNMQVGFCRKCGTKKVKFVA